MYTPVPVPVPGGVKSVLVDPSRMELGPNPLPIRNIFRDHFAAYAAAHSLTDEQFKAGGLIGQCKTGDLGFVATACPDCGTVQVRPCSCGNRSCPSCQTGNQEKWTRAKSADLIPGMPYYHLVLTLPHELNRLYRENQRPIISILFGAASGAILELCADPKYLGAKPSVLAVLHTWNQQMEQHLHLHLLISGGGLTPDGELLKIRTPNRAQRREKLYFLPESVISARFRTLFLRRLRDAYKEGMLSFGDDMEDLREQENWHYYTEKLFRLKWIAHIVGVSPNDTHVVKYLARYVFRTAVSNARVEYDGKTVRLRYNTRREGSDRRDVRQVKEMTPWEFIRLFLLHVLPKGVCRVRGYGLLANSCKKKKLTEAFHQAGAEYVPLALADVKVIDILTEKYPDKFNCCPNCRKQMCYLGRFEPRKEPFWLTVPAPPEPRAAAS